MISMQKTAVLSFSMDEGRKAEGLKWFAPVYVKGKLLAISGNSPDEVLEKQQVARAKFNS